MGKAILSNRLYRIYQNMKGRCTRTYNDAYPFYGGRGIKVCDEWLQKRTGFKSFEKWALENGYRGDLTLDRIDNDGNYEPSNCRWATIDEQHRNRRNSKFVNGVYMVDFAKDHKLHYYTLKQRIANGKTDEDLTKLPVRRIVIVDGEKYGVNEFCRKFGFNKNSMQTAFNRNQAKEFILRHYEESTLDSSLINTIETVTEEVAY